VGEEDFDASLEEVAVCGVARADGLRMQAAAVSVKACGKNLGIVENEEVGGAEEIGEVAECTVVDSISIGMEVEKAGGCAVGKRLLGDQVFRQMIVKVGNEHVK